MRLCPVCHGGVDTQEAMSRNLVVFHYNGRLYYLMCRQCKGDFLRDPERYTGGTHRGPALAPRPCTPSQGGNNGAM